MGTEFKSYSDLLRLYHALSAKCSQLYGRCRQNAVNCMDAVGKMQSIIWTLSATDTAWRPGARARRIVQYPDPV